MNQETRDAVREGAKRSAAAVLPMIFATLGKPAALLDVGGGEGHWTNEAASLGVPYVVNVDYDAPEDAWRWDAEQGTPLPLDPRNQRPWPLALCLEVAEHLTPAAGDHLVSELCRVATEIVWSAAIPGQGGDGHVNEQWPAYWAARFRAHGWTYDDPFRLDIWQMPGVEPWYAQNLLVYYPSTYNETGLTGPLPLVHPVTWAHHRGVEAPPRVQA